MNQEKLRKFQLIMLDMLKDIDKAFKENNIPYMLLCGNVLGAIRHKGFIPWDDDVDIGVFRADLEKVENILANMDKYFYESIEKHVIPDGPLGHLHLVNDEYPLENSPTIDVFPIDRVQDNYDAVPHRWFQLWANIYYLCIFRHEPRATKKMLRIPVKIFLFLCPKRGLDWLQKVSLKKVFKMGEGSSWLGNIWQGEKEYFPSYVYTELIDAEFEGEQFPIPKHYDEYLRKLYGDYMTLPAESERLPHHKNF